ncbi:CPBP family intramembrane metalloprotease domain-containing protein [Streptomyces dioscori]|uniref:CPBP family intramembrane metalloprotease domain-containing protein n=1 Tax=Streptomyces dioscori TaxID=2109333 RepID=A0A2P8PZE2_9ACTN|nr:type II CAAX endopeptidase family protein [Streptomyces dioscori]PSM39368.1 CPBP family intramembrane metalloprotease domain-containing protein [Streptomyces dioscori]
MSLWNTRAVRWVEDQYTQAHFEPTRRVWPAGVRLAVMVVLFVLVTGLAAGTRSVAGDNPVLSLLSGAVSVLIALTVYAAAVRFLEQRPVTELDLADAGSVLRVGTAAGLGLFAATIALIALFGGYGTEGGVSVGGALTVLGIMAGVAVVEELLFRGIIFRLVEELTGTRGAMVISGVLFGGLHLVNSGATVWGALAIAVEAGLMLGAVYAATRSLWMPIGLHFGWNYALSGIFGVTVSGNEDQPTGLLHGVLSGPEAITGGGFGPEASIFAILVCTVPTVVFLRIAKRRGRLYTRQQLRSAGTASAS